MVQVFVSHSSKDKDLVGVFHVAFGNLGVDAYFSEFETEAKPIPDKIRGAIRSSKLAVVLWTSSVSDVPATRDIVNSEIGEAHMADKPVLVFREEGVDVPLLVRYITDYYTFKRPDLAGALERLRAFIQKYRDEEEFWTTAGEVVLIAAAIAAVLGLVYVISRKK